MTNPIPEESPEQGNPGSSPNLRPLELDTARVAELATECIRTALHQVAQAHREILTDSAQTGEDAAKDEQGQIMKLDWQAEELIIQAFRDSGLPVRIFSEEHGLINIVDEPQILVVIDGLDGSSVFKSKRGEGRYATMVAAFAGLDPRYCDYLSSGIMQLSPNERLYLAEKDRGAWCEERDKDPLILSCPDHLRDPATLKGYIGIGGFIFPDKLVAQFFNDVEQFPYTCEAMSLVDIITGDADLIVEPTRKRNLEQMIAYGLLREAGAHLLDVNGTDIGEQRYFEFGQDDKRPQVLMVLPTLTLASEIMPRLFALKRSAEAAGVIPRADWGEQERLEHLRTDVVLIDLPFLVPATLEEQARLLRESQTFTPSDLESLLTTNTRFARPAAETLGIFGQTRLNPWTGAQDEDSYENIYEHMLAVSTLAREIALLCHEAGILEQTAIKVAALKGFLHDINKVMEILERKAIRQGVLDGEKPTRFIQQSGQLLRDAGFTEAFVKQVEDAGFITSPFGIAKFLAIEEGELALRVDGGLVNIIVRLADDMVCSRAGRHHLMTPRDRFVAAGNLLLDSHPENYAPAALEKDGTIIFGIDGSPTSRERITGQALSFHIVCAERSAEYIAHLLTRRFGSEIYYDRAAESLRDLLAKRLAV